MKNILFFISSNGYGHYDRCKTIASYLTNDFNVTLFSKNYQIEKLKPLEKCNHSILYKDTIRWDKNIALNSIRFNEYIEGLKEKANLLKKYDIVISDNIVGILKYRPDAILSGSFLWKDVFKEKFGNNKLSDFDNDLITKYNPLILTNKYFEVGSIKKYDNKKQFGFGCPSLPFVKNSINNIVFLKPSLNYLNSYSNYMDKFNLKYSTSINDINNVVMVARPGGGIITHCVKHHIPMIALYDNNDSSEIIDLANKVEELGIGIKQNVSEKPSKSLLDFYKDNSIYNSIQLTKNGYEKAANYIKSLVI